MYIYIYIYKNVYKYIYIYIELYTNTYTMYLYMLYDIVFSGFSGVIYPNRLITPKPQSR